MIYLLDIYLEFLMSDQDSILQIIKYQKSDKIHQIVSK